MDVISRIAELIGFDILFLGGITLAAWCIAAELWSDPRLSAAACVSCRKRIHEFLGGGEATAYRYVVLLLGAALIGMIINLTADRLLDQDSIVHGLPTLHWPPWHNVNYGWKAEDELKVEGAKSLGGLTTSSDVAKILRNHSIPPQAPAISAEAAVPEGPAKGPDSKSAALSADRKPHDATYYRIKDFMQHAYAAVEKADNGKLVPGLRYEFLVLKVLRVLLLLVLVLYAVMLIRIAAPVTRRKTLARLVSLLSATLCAFLLSQLLLWLWSQQSMRYYRRVIHAYVVVAATEDRALLDIPPASPPNP
jgi:hypothetical protein